MYSGTSVSQTTPILIPTFCGRPAISTQNLKMMMMMTMNYDKEEEDAAESEENNKQDGLQPLADGLVTLSLLPKSRWCNLHNLSEEV